MGNGAWYRFIGELYYDDELNFQIFAIKEVLNLGELEYSKGLITETNRITSTHEAE